MELENEAQGLGCRMPSVPSPESELVVAGASHLSWFLGSILLGPVVAIVGMGALVASGSAANQRRESIENERMGETGTNSVGRFSDASRLPVITNQIQKLNNEGWVLQRVLQNMAEGSNSISEMSDWWPSVQQEIIRLEACSVGPGPTWGPRPETTNSLNDWKVLGDKFEEYGERMLGHRSRSERRTPGSDTETD